VTALIALALAAGATAAPSRPFSACLVTDAGSLSDPGVARLAETGLAAAESLGVTGRVVRSPSAAADEAALESCVEGGADLTIGLGYLMAGAVNAVAAAYPHHVFVIVDASVTTLPSRPANVQGILFRSEQAGYLVGYAAGLWVKERKGKAVGTVAGLKIPPVDSYIAGFEAGAKRAFPAVKTLRRYVNTVTRESKCRAAALEQIDDGSLVELQVAGRCGAGVVSAARSKGVFVIATDSDESSLGPTVMTSAVKRIDLAVQSAILSARNGTLRTGKNVVYGAKKDGVGFGLWSPDVPAHIRAAVARQLQLIKAGVIRDIPSTVD
jgi:basic membrane protein A and related proteins